MANTPNVELEAAKFLHKLIQESKDEPTKLATKLYVILQHMRSSGKENSMPYQVISRAMETVIKQHNLDIEALMSSRLPVASGAEVGDSTSSQLAGPSQRAGVANNALANELGRPDAHALSRGQVGPTSGGQDIYHGNASPSSGATKLHGGAQGASGSYAGVDSGISNPMHFGSPLYDNHGFAPKMQNEKTTETYSATPSFDLSASKSSGKAVDHGGGTNMVEHKAIQGAVVNNAPEMSMLKSVAPRDTGKSPSSSVPFKEQQLRQLRAQCLVFLAFRNGLMPKKLHLEIALGNIMSKDDGQRREQSISDPSNVPEVTRPFVRADFARESDRLPPGSSSGEILAEANSSKEAENSYMEDRSGPPTGLYENVEDGKNHFTKKPEAEETTESQSSTPRGLTRDSNIRGLTVSHNRNDLKNTGQQNGTSNQASFNVATGHPRKDNAHNHPPAERNYQANRFAEINLPSFQSREQWTSMSAMDGQNALALPVKDTDMTMNNISRVHESEPEEDDNSVSNDRPPSPKYTTVDKWILDRQKRKALSEQKWAQKQQKTENKIITCYEKLKENVSTSEDIFAKTKSMIELKKLQLLGLQRRLRSGILNDFSKPIAADMDRLKSIKKHRIGRKSKQLERYEQRMKEERQKRFRERQKEFFSEIEVHRERLEDIFKQRRERWKGFNKCAREFHKRKERIHREKIDRIQREKINLLKINDVEGYLRMVQDAKSDRVKQLLKETEKYLSKLGAKLQQAKVMTRRFETEMDESRSTGVVEKSDFDFEDEDDTDQAKHYLESNEKYYMMAHSIKETITEQPTCLVGGKLREYQMNGLRWLVSLYNNHLNGILADEMGLGKTVQVISLICYLMENKNDRGPFLVVVPSSVLPGWESEINFWAPSIHKIVYSGPPEERRRLFKEQIVHPKFNVLLTTYEYLMNKHDRPKLSKVQWHYIIIDEGHRIKNASCKLNADLKHYRSNHRLLLTGTPLQNNLEELWALLNFLLPNIFNSSEDFSQWFNKPFESNGDNSPDEALLSEEENLLIINRLHQVLRPFVLRRLKHKVENQLPEKIERLIRCEASSYQKLLMKRVEENLGAFGTTKARSVHNSVMELRNICNHPYLSQLHVEEVHDLIPKHYLPNVVRLCGKLEMLDRLLPKLKATDHRVLLFSTMTRLLDVMEEYLYWKQYKYLRLDGHTSGGERGALIDHFNRPDSPYFIFLLSIRAGGVGVNLQAADTVIIFDTDWNPQVDLQAQARAHRIGQKKDVLVLRLETVQTVEEQVRAAAEHKLGVANQSITAGFFDNNTSAEDRREYLESLLRECKKEEDGPVLGDDALNDLIARSESEIDIFESIDNRRREEEMAAWKQLVTEKEAESSPLPPRLLTDDDLKAFCEAMITEEPHPRVTSVPGVKRKGDLGGLDTQHYGRGKRAREVRSYEEQWTEEEFEKMCQVDSSGSPNYKDPNLEKLPIVTSGSVVASSVKLDVPVVQPRLQSPFDATGQRNMEVTPPSKRGRGRPRRIVPAPSIPAPVALSAPSVVGKMEPDSAAVNASVALSAPAVVGKLEPGSAAENASVALSAPAVVGKMEPGSAAVNASVGPSAPAVVGNMESGSAALNASAALSEPAVDGKMEPGSAAVNASISSVFHGPDSLPSSTPVRSITGNINQVGVFAAPSPQSTPLPSSGPVSQSTLLAPPAKGRGRGRKAQTGEAPRRRGKKPNLVLQDVPVTSMPSESVKPAMVNHGIAIPTSPLAAPDPQPDSSSATTGEASKELTAVSPIPILLSSSSVERPGMVKQEITIPSSSTAPDPQPASCSASLGEVSEEPNAVSPVPVLQSSSVIEKVNVAVPRESISYSLVPGPESFPGLPIVMSTDKEDRGIRHAPASEPAPSLSSVVPASQTILSQSEPKRGRGRGRGRGGRPQVEGEVPRRRGRRQESATSIVPIGSVDQDPKSIEPPQKRSRVSAAGRRASTRGRQDSEPQILTPSIQLNAAQTTSGPAKGQNHNVEQGNGSQERTSDAKSDVSRGCANPAIGHADAEHSIAIMKDFSDKPPSPEAKKDASPRSEYIDSQTLPASSINEVSKGPNLCSSTSSVLSEFTAQSSDLKDADNRSQSQKNGAEQPINAAQSHTSLTRQDPSIGQICIPDGKSNITETNEVKSQKLSSEATFKESLGSETGPTSNLPSSSKTHTSISTHRSEIPLDKVAEEMSESEVRKEVRMNAVPLDKVTNEICKSQCRIGNEEGTVRADDIISEISESQAKNENRAKAGEMQDPSADKTSDLLAPSAPASDFSFVQSDNHVGKLGDLDKEEPADSQSINNALNNSVTQSEKGEKLDKESEDPAPYDVSATVLGLPSIRSSDLAVSNTDEMSKSQANKEDAEDHKLAQNALVDETSDLLASCEPASDLLVLPDGHSGNQEDKEKEDPALTEVPVSSYASPDTAHPSTDVALNKSGYVFKDHIIDQDSKDSAPCNAPQLNSDTMTSTLKSAAIVDIDEMSEGQTIKDDVDKESQLDETSALLDCSAPASDLSLRRADSHSGPLERQEKEDNALTQAPALSNSADLSGKEDRIDQEITDPAPCDASESNLDLPASSTWCGNVNDQTLDDTSASAVSSLNVVEKTDETCEAPADKGEVETERQMQNTLVDETTPILSASAPASDLSLVPAVSHLSKPEVEEKDDPGLSNVLVSEFPTLATTPPNIDITASNNPKDQSANEDGMDQESKECATSDATDLNSNLPASVETCSGDVQEQCLDDTLASTISASIVDNNVDDMREGQPSKDDVENDGLLQNPSLDKTDFPSVQADSLEEQEKEDPALMEVLVSDVPTTDAASPSINIGLNNSGDLSEKGDRTELQSKEHAPCDASVSNMDLPASIETCCEVVKDQTLDDTSASPLRSAAIVDGTTDELCEGQANKKGMGKECQLQNTPVESAPIARVSDLLSNPTDSHSRKLEDREEDPAPTEVLVEGLPTMVTTSTIIEIPFNNSEDSSGKDDMIEKEGKSSPYDIPGLRFDLPASTENCGEDVKDEKLDDASPSNSRSPGIVDCTTAETCGSLGSKEDGLKGGHMQNPSTDETSVIPAPGLAITETPAASSDIPLNGSGDVSGKEDRLDEESQDSAPRSMLEQKPDLPVSTQTSTGDGKDQTVDDSHGSASPLRSTGADESIADESDKAQAGQEDVTGVGVMKISSIDENFDPLAPVEPVPDLLQGGGHSHCGKPEEQEKKDPAANEVCDPMSSNIESATPSVCIAQNNSDTLPEEQNTINKQSDDSALEGSDLAKNASSPEKLLTSKPEDSALGSPNSESENVSAKEVEEEKNRNTLVDAPLGSKPEMTEVDNSSAEGQDPPAL